LTVTVLLQDIMKLETGALVVGFFEDVRPLKGLAGELDWLLCGSLSRLILNNKLRGTLGDVALLTSQGKLPTQKIFMVGLGPKATFTSSAARSAAVAAAATVLGTGVTKAAMEFFPVSDASFESSVSVLREGLSQGAGGRGFDVSLLAPDAAAYEKIARLVNQ
jgi:Cytosol aminopeptidase family, N-terminal domain